MEYRHLDLQAYIPSHIHLRFVDLFDTDSRITSIHHLKKAADQERVQTKVIVCGGDGTINWVINELVKHEVDLAKSHFGVIPIGTGNDFCRAIGWQVETFDFSF
jgi:diacylglycerol kinase (ATP)